MDAFDADVLIYAAAPDHPLGRRVLPLLLGEGDHVGSLLLLPELLSKPLREGGEDSPEVRRLLALLARLELRPVDLVTAHVATDVARTYRLRAADAVHLATAVVAGADRFLTNNRRDFPSSMAEIDVVHPGDLPPGV